MDNADSPVKSRARVAETVEALERGVLQRNGKAVRGLVQTLKQDLETAPNPALEAGALQALLGALNHGWKDLVITETVFAALLALAGKRVTVANSAVSAAALVRLDGILLLIRVGNEYKANVKVRASVIGLLRLFAAEENGARLVFWAGGIPVLVEALDSTDRLLVIAATTALVLINVFHLAARAATSRGVEALLQASRRFKADAEVMEQTMACLCLIAQTRLGAMTIMTFAPTSKPSSNAFSEAAALAFDALKHMDTASQTEVVATGRRACAWAMMLVHNLALFGDPVIRLDAFSSLEALDPGRRELGARILVRLSTMIEQSQHVVDAAATDEDGGDDGTRGNGTARALVLRVAHGDSALGGGGGGGGEAEESELVCFAALFAMECLGVSCTALLRATLDALQHQFLVSSTGTLAAERGALPVVPPAMRLFSMLHTLLTHPVLKRGVASPEAVAACRAVVDVVKTTDPPEFFRTVARSLEQGLGAAATGQEILLPYRRFPLHAAAVAVLPSLSTPSPAKLSGAALKSPVTPMMTPPPESSAKADGPFDEPASLWDAASPEELVRQFTLRMERLYFALDARLVFAGSQSPALLKFLAYHADLVVFFQAHVLAQPTADVRARAIEFLIRMAAYAATTPVSNLDLTMAVLDALQQRAISRLGCSWRLVARGEADRLDELLRLSAVSDALPPPILRCPSVPYLAGCMRALPPALTHDSLVQHYRVLSAWLPLLGRNGDWFAKPHAFAVDPSLQMQLAKLALSEEFDAMAQSRAAEPEWAQEQLVVDCEARVQAVVERLLGSDESSKEHAMLRRFRALPLELVTASEAGQVCRELTKMVLDNRRAQLLAETGVRTELLWPVLARRVALCVEAMVLSGCRGWLMLAAMRACEDRELQLGTRVAALRDAPVAVRERFFGLRNPDATEWLPAVAALDAVNDVVSPTLVLDVLLRTKDAIFAGAKALGMKEMAADDFLPVLALVAMRAKLKSPWALCDLLQALLSPEDIDNGERGYYFVSLTMALNLIASFDLALLAHAEPVVPMPPPASSSSSSSADAIDGGDEPLLDFS